MYVFYRYLVQDSVLVSESEVFGWAGCLPIETRGRSSFLGEHAANYGIIQ